jgi:signal transduction histidine kinase
VTQPGDDPHPHAQVLSQEARASGNLLALSAISRLINSHLDPQELCDTVVRLLQESFDYDRVAIGTLESTAVLPPGAHGRTPAIVKSLSGVIPWFASRDAYLVPQGGEELKTDELERWCLVLRATGGESYAPASSPLTLGIVGRVARTGQAALLVDVKSDPDYMELLPGVLSEIAVPLALQQEIQGILNVESIKRRLDEHDFMLLRGVGDLLSVALHNARLYQQAQRERDVAQRSADLLLALHHISHEVLTLPYLDDILERITSAAMEISGGVYASLHLPAPPPEQELMLVATRSTRPLPQEKVQRYRSQPGWGVIGMCFAQGIIIAIQETQDDPRLAHNPIVERWQLRSVIALPLIAREQTLGVLSVGHAAPARFSPELQQALALLADQAAIAIRRARLDEELREALERATELDHLKDHFLLMASHELRTPLTAVMGFLELLSDYPGRLSEEPAQRFLERARTGAEELTLLLGNILDGTRGSLDRSKLIFEEIALAPLVNRILPLISARARHTLISRVPEGLYIWADEMKVQQVLLNLLANAVKYSPNDTTITIDAQPDEAAGMVTVSVRDEGDGIPLEDQPRLFQKFVRLNEGINSTVRGTGLGLYISRLLVEGMDGQIGLQSTPGQGSTFWFRLPARRKG